MLKRKMKCVLERSNKIYYDNRYVVGCPHERLLLFSDWLRNLSNEKLIINDIDFVIVNNETKTILILEVKTNFVHFPNTALPSKSQKILLNMVHKVFNKLSEIITGWKFKGVHLIQFESYDFTDGNCYLDNKLITEEQLKNFILQ